MRIINIGANIMKRNNSKTYWGSAALMSAAAFFIVKYGGPVFIQYLFDKENFNILNFLSQTNQKQVLAFYQGMIHDNVTGPIEQILALFTVVFLYPVFLRNASFKKYFSVIFLYLLASRPEILFFPPYGDSAGGPFVEAWWLYKNSFNYVELYRQPTFLQGGPKVYLFSLYPTFLALLLNLIPHTPTFLVVNHVVVFLAGAGVIAMTRKMARCLYDDPIATLISLVVLSLPLFQSQVEAINMEVILLCVSIMAVYYLCQKRIWRAALFSILAAMVKGYAVCFCLAVFAASLLIFTFDCKRRWDWKILLSGIMTLGFVILKTYASFYLLYANGKMAMIGPFEGWASFKIILITYAFGLSLILFLVQRIYAVWSKKENFNDFIKKHYIALVMFLSAGAWFAVFLNSYALSPRYRLLTYPFISLGMAYVLIPIIRNRKAVISLLCAVIFMGSLCSYGLFVGALKGGYHVVLERNLGYRNDLIMYQRLAKLVEKKYNRFLIGAPYLVAQMLAIPRLGYVEKDLDVMIYGYLVTYEGIKNFTGLKHIPIPKTIWVAAHHDSSKIIDYPIAKEDHVIEEVEYGAKKSIIFMGGFGIERMRLIAQQRYLSGHKPAWLD